MDFQHKEFVSPFSSRYASKEMSYLFSEHYRGVLFRKLWIALAKGEKKLGLPITQEQITSMQRHVETIDLKAVREYEKKFRHDVMAHIHAFGDLCPSAKPIIHLGATSSFVTDNADLIQMKEAILLLSQKMAHVLEKMALLSRKNRKVPCVGFTHFQTAQPTTVGKRICLWLQDFLWDAKEWERIVQDLPFLGVKGATGTQNSFLLLFQGNGKKVLQLEKELQKEFGFSTLLPIAGQTYTRKIDVQILHSLSSFAASAHKMATDIRLLAHEGEMVEKSDASQVGSSAMPHKQNPIYAERISGLARFVMSLASNGTNTLSTQWLERSLDDSSNKRLSIPEAFLGADALLNLLAHLLDRLFILPKVCQKHLEKQIPYLVLENLLMHAAQKGEDRQATHEALRKIAKQMPVDASLSSLKEALQKVEGFRLTRQEEKKLFSPSSLIGRAPEQVDAFLKDEVIPFLKKQRHKKRVPKPVVV